MKRCSKKLTRSISIANPWLPPEHVLSAKLTRTDLSGKQWASPSQCTVAGDLCLATAVTHTLAAARCSLIALRCTHPLCTLPDHKNVVPTSILCHVRIYRQMCDQNGCKKM